jgi:predicted DNA-binding transcriptional regulator YafY
MEKIYAMIARTMQHSDDLVVVFEYRDRHGQMSRRVVSPIRFVGNDCWLGLCLSRAEPRQFQLQRCQNVRIGLACNYVMPLEPEMRPEAA